MRRAAILLGLLLLAACADDDLAGSAAPRGMDTSCYEYVASVSLDVAPATLTRGTSDTLSIDWTLDSGVGVPVLVHLTTGPQYSIELTTELSPRDGQFAVYGVDLANPFGLGAPVDFVNVYTWLGVSTACPPPLDATTTFDLN